MSRQVTPGQVKYNESMVKRHLIRDTRSHTVERDSSRLRAQESIVSCTQEEIMEYIDAHPQSALALLYDLDLEQYSEVDSDVPKTMEQVTWLLFNNEIPYPHQTLDELCSYLQESVFDKLKP